MIRYTVGLVLAVGDADGFHCEYTARGQLLNVWMYQMCHQICCNVVGGQARVHEFSLDEFVLSARSIVRLSVDVNCALEGSAGVSLSCGCQH